MNWFKEMDIGSAHDAHVNGNAMDLRGLEPPEPLLRVLDAVESAAPDPLVFLLSREPLPLYAILARTGWRYEVREAEGGVELTVMRR